LGTAITTGGAAAFDGDYGHYSGVTALAQHPYDDQVWLIDKPRPQDNPNLAFVLHDTVTVLEQLRHEGRTVLLHCVQAQSRTPSVAARKNGVSTTQALDDIHGVLPEADPNPAFRAALRATEGPDEELGPVGAMMQGQAQSCSTSATKSAIGNQLEASSGSRRTS